MSKKTLAVELSKLGTFNDPDQSLEQYPTDSEIAAEALWTANMHGWINEKIIADFGAGTGILGIGCLLLGANKVFFVEKDKKAIKVLKQNLAQISKEYDVKEFEIIHSDIEDFDEKTDLVVMNPPFGTITKGSDIEFLEKAMTITSKILSFHKTNTSPHISKFLKENKLAITEKVDTSFPLKKSLSHHKKRVERIEVTFWLVYK